METFIEYIKAILFGIIEGITEWLPISSTGHMIILEQFFGFQNTQGKDFTNFFLVIVQLGAICAVIVNYFKNLWPFGKNKSPQKKREIWQIWLKILIASVPAGIVGILFNSYIDQYLYNYVTVAITLIVYGVFFLLIEALLRKRADDIQKRYHLNMTEETASENEREDALARYPLFHTHHVREITVQQAMILGLAQMLALIPGTSRSGVTICAALLLSIDRSTSARFSFYMAIPAMFGGSLVEAIRYGVHVSHGEASAITGNQVGLIVVAMLVAFGVSLLVVNYFMKFLKTHTFLGFGVYRIVLGIILIIVFFTVNGGNLSTGVNTDTSSAAALLTEINSSNILSFSPRFSRCVPSFLTL